MGYNGFEFAGFGGFDANELRKHLDLLYQHTSPEYVKTEEFSG